MISEEEIERYSKEIPQKENFLNFLTILIIFLFN